MNTKSQRASICHVGSFVSLLIQLSQFPWKLFQQVFNNKFCGFDNDYNIDFHEPHLFYEFLRLLYNHEASISY